MKNKNIYIWCSYRDWSFQILEAIQGAEGWTTGLIITTENCTYNFGKLEERGIPILRIDSKKAKKEFQKGGKAYETILQIKPDTIITPGWSWYVPEEIITYVPCVTFHPGKLPKDRGGSPIQNQIRNGENWTYLNVMKQEKGLDEGAVYLKEKILLDGSADDVWIRMTSTGVVLTLEYLKNLAAQTLNPQLQAEKPPVIYKRVKEEDAELNPNKQEAKLMHNIVRAHYETDPNSYVVKANIPLNDDFILEIYNATLENSLNKNVQIIIPHENYGNEIFTYVSKTNNKELVLALVDKNGDHLYLNQVNVILK